MRIRIDFADLPEEVNISEPGALYADNLVNHIQDNYFNGADNAVKYLRTDIDFEYIELEIIPN